LLESVNYFVPMLLYVLIGAAICVGLIMSVRLFRAFINASRALEQMGRAMEDIASTLKRDRHATQEIVKEELF